MIKKIRSEKKTGAPTWTGTPRLQAYHLIRRLWLDRDYDYTQQALADIFRTSIENINSIINYRSSDKIKSLIKGEYDE